MPRGGVEQENYGLLCSKVADLVLPNISDRWCWFLEGSQEFSVKSSRILIGNTILPKAEVPTRWLRVVPIKIKINRDLFTSDIQGTRTYEEYKLNNPMKKDLEEPWLDNGVPYQLCDPYCFKNGVTKWPTCSSDIDGFCNGGELPRMVWVGSMTYF
nr:RNA-directed DNA polymerase, eukaryota [Tanacetum cinerariifolium]